jgi:hypothetical protein
VTEEHSQLPPQGAQAGPPDADLLHTEEARGWPPKRQAKAICAGLNESKRWEIQKVVMAAGLEATLAVVDEALAVEAQGGMMTSDGSRRRTLGGVFFWLAHE